MASLHSVGTFHLACCTRGKEGSGQMVYTPGMLPVVSKDLDSAFLRETMSCTFFTVILETWSCNEWFSVAEWCSNGTLGTLWSWNALCWWCLCFRNSFSADFLVVIFLAILL